MIRISDVRRVRSSGQAAKPAPRSVVPAKSDHSKPLAQKMQSSDDSDAAKTLLGVLADATKAGAAAIHIEPHGAETVVRYRVDGLLREGKAVPKKVAPALVARVKLLANLDAKETRVPQDGRFEITVGRQAYAVRASVLPVADGEKIVLHVRNQSAAPNDLEKLGYWGQSLSALQDAVARKHGMVLVNGPVGMGKSATLYGLLHMVADPTLNIATVESAIEHRIPRINQAVVNIKAGMTHADTLRAALHQDPNVVMVSELHEPDTIHVAIQAALAGRLVLGGLHAPDTPATFSYLVAAGVEPYMVASGVRAVANQRLVRRLCTECRESYEPAAEEVVSAIKACGLSPRSALYHLTQLEKPAAKALGVKSPSSPAVTIATIGRLWQPKATGCAACGGTGYKGRIAIAEVLTVSPAIQKLIFGTVPAHALYNQAITEGMIPISLDGLVKAVLGITSMAEVLRVIAE